ncbi:MAG: hypothetical protein JRH01_05540 [Deltaproteobacteria bacterium]|nr:hypothetical protein [Deltaproteobacteria bacterium]MBW2361446.1 hypothetical protein [Deltaproteobacteria bacterium]
MARHRSRSLGALLIAISLASWMPSGSRAQTGGGAGAPEQDRPIYGRDLMTEQERNEHRERIRNAGSEQEREQIRLEHHERMRERAKERGVELPPAPPPRGSGAGGGQGRGRGR